MQEVFFFSEGDFTISIDFYIYLLCCECLLNFFHFEHDICGFVATFRHDDFCTNPRYYRRVDLGSVASQNERFRANVTATQARKRRL